MTNVYRIVKSRFVMFAPHGQGNHPSNLGFYKIVLIGLSGAQDSPVSDFASALAFAFGAGLARPLADFAACRYALIAVARR